MRRLSVLDQPLMFDQINIKPPLHSIQKAREKTILTSSGLLKSIKTLKKESGSDSNSMRLINGNQSPLRSLDLKISQNLSKNNSGIDTFSNSNNSMDKGNMKVSKSCSRFTEAKNLAKELDGKHGSIEDSQENLNSIRPCTYEDKLITTISDLFTSFECVIVSQNDQEISVKNHAKNKIVKISKTLFTQYSDSFVKTDKEDDISPIKYSIHVGSPNKGNKNNEEEKGGSIPKLKFTVSPKQIIKKPEMQPNIEKASEVQGNNAKTDAKNEGTKKNFADILNGLEDMSENSTLLGGIGDDDDDAPPSMFGKTIKPIKAVEQDQSQIHESNNKDRSNKSIKNKEEQKEIDPFDLRNFK